MCWSVSVLEETFDLLDLIFFNNFFHVDGEFDFALERLIHYIIFFSHFLKEKFEFILRDFYYFQRFDVFFNLFLTDPFGLFIDISRLIFTAQLQHGLHDISSLKIVFVLDHRYDAFISKKRNETGMVNGELRVSVIFPKRIGINRFPVLLKFLLKKRNGLFFQFFFLLNRTRQGFAFAFDRRGEFFLFSIRLGFRFLFDHGILIFFNLNQYISVDKDLEYFYD